MRGDATKDDMGSLLFPEQPNQVSRVPVPASNVALHRPAILSSQLGSVRSAVSMIMDPDVTRDAAPSIRRLSTTAEYASSCFLPTEWHALPLLGKDPFFILNADTFWLDGAVPALPSMAKAWDDATMDMILLLADPAHATGHTGGTDFLADPAGRLSRARGSAGGYIYAGAALIHPRVFSNAPAGPHSLNLHFDRLIGEGRLFGHVMDGQWITVGTPDAIAPAEEAIRRHGRA